MLFQNVVIAVFAQFLPSSVNEIAEELYPPRKIFALLNELYSEIPIFIDETFNMDIVE